MALHLCVCLNPVLSQPRQKSLNMWARSDNVIGLGITVDQKCQALVELDDDYGIDSIDNDDDNDALREVNARGGVGDGSAGWQISNYQFHHHQEGERWAWEQFALSN